MPSCTSLISNLQKHVSNEKEMNGLPNVCMGGIFSVTTLFFLKKLVHPHPPLPLPLQSFTEYISP